VRLEPIVFLAQGVVPDIVVLGKLIGNGVPLAAMEFFSTFGGNPVACDAVLDEDPVRTG
jgi:acetylornithine/succinyldiaminopimelate/putrescine aminotransferase